MTFLLAPEGVAYAGGSATFDESAPWTGTPGIAGPIPAPLDPVTFEPYPEDAPPVSLGLTYDSTPSVRAGLIPVWLGLVVVAYVAANYAGGRV